MLYKSDRLLKLLITFLSFNMSQIWADDYVTSITGLENLLKTEAILLQDFRKYVEMKKEYVNSMERELLRMEEHNKLAISNTDDYLTNPINVYLLMKRLYSDWYSYKERIRNDVEGEYFLKRLEINKAELDFPDAYDMYDAAIALMRLQSTYKLNVSDIVAGKLNGMQYGTQMSWHDCYEIGRQLHVAQEYNFTKLWLKESVKLLMMAENLTENHAALNTIETIAESLFELGDIRTAYNISSYIIKIDPERKKSWDITYRAKSLLKNFEEKIIVPTTYNWQQEYHKTEEFKTYEKLCRAEITPTLSQERHLRCRYITNNKSYRLFAPFKVEEHSTDPFVITIHDVLTSKKADTVRKLGTPHLKRSTVRAIDRSAISDVRVSKNAWIPYRNHSYTMDLLNILQDATGLDTSKCEDLQVANYGLGGHYEPHWDFYLPEEMTLIPAGEGNRIATAIFYLTDVEQGGATVFPYLNITIRPRKGNMLFWYNQHYSLDRDYRTRHAGCPVLKGSKWIANVWINDITQAFSRPCLTQRDHEASLEYEKIK